MRVLSGALGAALFLALSANPAAAEILTVGITARVESLSDPDNVFGGQVSVGQAARGRYSYETTVPDQYPSILETGQYLQSPQQGRMSLSVGPFSFETDAASPNWMFPIYINRSYLMEYPTPFSIWSQGNKLLANGASVMQFGVFFTSNQGAVLTSDALFTSAPNLSIFTDRQVFVVGQSVTGGWYFLQLRIDSVTVIPSLQVSPADGGFIRPQRIDPALLLPDNAQIGALRGSVNGMPLPTTYLEQCRIAPPNAQSRTATYCPDIIPFLLGGPNHVEWSVDFTDGSTATRAVDWEMIE